MCSSSRSPRYRVVSPVRPNCAFGAEPRVGPSGYTGPVTVTADPLLPDLQRALAGRYLLERRLGRGGMGVVYLARELRLDRRVAIKLLPPERALQATERQRFLREARTAAQLSHPGIVPIFAVHEVSDFVYFAMAYVDGDTLGRRVRQRGPLPHDAAARLLEEVARALAYAHDRGVVHRDVKPDNILLDLATGRALVSDFGIARVGSDTTTGPQRVVGTAEFMSPEQVLGERVDPRSDLYSLGVVGFFTLSGELPFVGPNDMSVLARHVSEPPPPLASVAPGVPPRLAATIDRCLAKDPDARFPNGEALADAVAAGIVAALERIPELAGVVGVPSAFAVVAGAALLAAVVARARTEHRTDPKAERRLRFWNGALGRGLFMLAGLNLTPSKGGEVTPAPDARDA